MRTIKYFLGMVVLSLLLVACPAASPDEIDATTIAEASATSQSQTSDPSPTSEPTATTSVPTPTPTVVPVGWRKITMTPRADTQASYWIEVDVSERRKITA